MKTHTPASTLRRKEAWICGLCRMPSNSSHVRRSSPDTSATWKKPRKLSAHSFAGQAAGLRARPSGCVVWDRKSVIWIRRARAAHARAQDIFTKGLPAIAWRAADPSGDPGGRGSFTLARFVAARTMRPRASSGREPSNLTRTAPNPSRAKAQKMATSGPFTLRR